MANEKKDLNEAAKPVPEEDAERAETRKSQPTWRARLRVAEQWSEHYTVNVASGINALSEGKPVALRMISGLGFQVPDNVLYVGRNVDSREEHEKTRQLITDKLAALPQREDLINAKEEIIRELSAQIEGLEMQLAITATELAKSRELEACTTRVCNEIRLENEETRRALNEQLLDLRTHLSKLAPHKRFFRLTFGILCFLAASVITNSLWGVRIVEPLWAAAGLFLSSAMLIVIYFGMKDVQGRDGEYRNE